MVSEQASIPVTQEQVGKQAQEFVWLFEYGLEMDVSFLNSRERLDGCALLYGPAVLKGFHIAFDAMKSPAGQVVANIRRSQEYEEVWGMLYRIPARLLEPSGDELSLLDKAHANFEAVDVVVRETYRNREITSIVYIASPSARREFHLLPPERQNVSTAYVKHLLAIARQHKLPAGYVQEIEERAAIKLDVHSTPTQQNTEPVAIVPARISSQTTLDTTYSSLQNRRLTLFAAYLLALLAGVLTLGVLQGLGFWGTILTGHFAPLAIPWFVLAYGLLGGCLSGIITLGWRREINPPPFVLVSWLARPFIGALFAALAYLVLSSVVGTNIQQHSSLSSLLGALAGSCEGWVFYPPWRTTRQ